MNDGAVTRADDVLVLEDRKLRLELADSMHRVRRRCKYETSADVLVVDALEPDAHVVATHRAGNLLLELVVRLCYLDRRAIRHHHERVVSLQSSGLDLADDDRAHVFVLLRDG